MSKQQFELEKMLRDPKGCFGTPDQVLQDKELDNETKHAILQSWEQDARELAVAEEEGMSGGEADMLQRIHFALEALPVSDQRMSTQTTKHGG